MRLYYRFLANRANIKNPEMQFAYCEYRRLFKNDKAITRLKHCASRFVPDSAVAAPLVCTEIKKAIDAKCPFSLIRIGNGEGNAVSMLRPSLHPATVKAFYTEFCSQNGLSVPLNSAIEFCADVQDALSSADVKGVRFFRFNEMALIEDRIRHNDLYACLGLTYARQFFYEELRTGHC